jgi:predicted nuclease of predicted toxin-antitoxin system
VDENMPRSLAAQIEATRWAVRDVRDIGLRGQPDEDVLAAALAADEIVITRDRGFTFEKGWSEGFTAGVIFVNLPDDTPADEVSISSQQPPVVPATTHQRIEDDKRENGRRPGGRRAPPAA